MKEYIKIYFFMRVIIKLGGYFLKKDNIQNKRKIINKIILILAIFSTYIMSFLLGRITNTLTLGIKDKEDSNNNTPVLENTAKPNLPQIPNYNKEEVNVDEIITLLEGNKKWSQLNELKIFESNFYGKKYEDKIAPGFYGSYEFTLQNNRNTPIRYILSFKEENPKNINMVYSVQKEGKYVLGDVNKNEYINEVKLPELVIDANSKLDYKLNWKWEDTNNDTEIAEMDIAKYRLSIKVQAVVEEGV